MKSKKIDKNLIGYIIGIVVILFLFIFLVTCTQIGYSVRNQCEMAQGRYGGECVDALMAKLSDDSTEYGKNSVIWALGEMGDKKALPLLKSFETGKEDMPGGSYDIGISQFELRKAIKLLESGFNLSAFVWR